MNYRILLSRHRSAIMGVAALMIVFFHSEWHGLPAYAVHLQRHMNVGVDIFVFLSGFGWFGRCGSSRISHPTIAAGCAGFCPPAMP